MTLFGGVLESASPVFPVAAFPEGGDLRGACGGPESGLTT